MAEEGKASLKVVLIGASGVGKTSLIKSFFENPLENLELSTVSPASCTADIKINDNFEVSLEIWDTAGQERYQAISEMFYHETQIAFICYDVGNEDTIGYWVSKVRSSAPECLVFLVLTKADVLAQDVIGECIEKGCETMTKLECRLHIVTSAKTGMGVRELFREAAFSYVDINRPTETKSVDIKQRNHKKCCKN